jgi:hypothetical protein
MSRTRRTFVRVLVVWTLLMLLAGVLLTAQAIWTIYDAQQACFFNYPAIPCPQGDDPAVGRLTFAFFGVPLVWLVGIGFAALVRATRSRRP